MADLTSLTATTTPAATDLVYVVKDPAGTPLPRKAAISDVVALAAAVELAYAETVATQQTTNNTVVDVTGASISFTVGARPVHVYGVLGAAGHITAGQSITGHITDGANAIKRSGYHTSGVASELGTVLIHERIAAGAGAVTRKLRFVGSSATANSAFIMFLNAGDAYIVALQT